MKTVRIFLTGTAALVLAGCQSGSGTGGDVSSYEYCQRDLVRLETQYRDALADGVFRRAEKMVQPRNISEKCLVHMWSQGDPGDYDVTWNGACEKGYAKGLGLVTLRDADGNTDSIRLYEGLGNGRMISYFGYSMSSGKVWYGYDDGHQGRFYVTDLGNDDLVGEYALSRIDYDTARTDEFIYSGEGTAAARMQPNFSEIFSRSYAEGNYVSDLFYAIYEQTPDGESHMTGVGFVLSGHDDDSLKAIDTSSDSKVERDPDVALNARYLNERLNAEKDLFKVRGALVAAMPADLKLARSKLKDYQYMACTKKRYYKLHITADDAEGICKLKEQIPAGFLN